MPAADAVSARNPLGFFLFLVVNAALFVRPSELIYDLRTWEIYLVLILACLAVSFPAVIRQVATASLRNSPITVCVLLLLPMVGLSRLAQLDVVGAACGSFEFFKVVIYYLLFVGLVNTPGRIRRFLFCFVFFCLALVVAAVLHFYGVITIVDLNTVIDHRWDPGLGMEVVFPRLRSTGEFHDPNDLSLILVVGMIVSLYWTGERRFGAFRFLWLAPLVFFGFALGLTYSRGGFLALVIGAVAFMRCRFGWTRTIVLGTFVLPLLFALFAGRQTSISTEETTGQTRIQLWSDGFMLFRENPLIGIGYNQYQDRAGQVAHNSFLHCYTELGFLGGTLFLCAFVFGIAKMSQAAVQREAIVDPDMRRLAPYLTAAVAAYVGGLLSLSDSYIVATYTMLGLMTAFLGIVARSAPSLQMKLDLRFLLRSCALSCMFLAGTYVFIRLFLNRA
jgi:hypothetical protein